MSGRTPTWDAVGVIGLAGFSAGLLVAALLVAGRTQPRPTQFGGPAPAVATEAQPATVTVTGAAPAPPTVTERLTSPPQTTTSYVEVTVTPTETSTPSTTTPTTRGFPSDFWRF